MGVSVGDKWYLVGVSVGGVSGSVGVSVKCWCVGVHATAVDDADLNHAQGPTDRTGQHAILRASA